MTDQPDDITAILDPADRSLAIEEIVRLRMERDAAYERAAVVAEGFYRKSTFNSRVRSLGQETCDLIAYAIRALKEGTT